MSRLLLHLLVRFSVPKQLFAPSKTVADSPTDAPCLWSPLPDSSLAGQEHGRTIPLGDIGRGRRWLSPSVKTVFAVMEELTFKWPDSSL
jgi:hypothetical protein